MSERSKKPNGGVLPFPSPTSSFEDDHLDSTGWREIRFTSWHQSLDPTRPPAYLLELQGMRLDGVVFTVKIGLDKNKIDLVPIPGRVLEIVRNAMAGALVSLQTFRDCACTVDTSCKEHQTQ